MKNSKSSTENLIIAMGFFYPVVLSSLTRFIVPMASMQLLINICVFAFSAYVMSKRHVATKIPVYNIMLMAMALFIVYGYVTVRDAEYWAHFRYVAFLLFFMWGMRKNMWVDYLLKAILVMGIVYAVATIWLAFDKWTYMNVIINLYPLARAKLIGLYSQNLFAGITDHYSTNGMMLANALIVVLAFFITQQKMPSGDKKPYGVMFAVITVALFLTAKRAHLIFSFAAAFIAYTVCMRKEKNHILKSIGIILGVTVLVYVSYLFIPQVRVVVNRFTESGDDVNTLGRYIFWRAAWNKFLNNKLLGIGWFGFRNNVAPTVNYTGHCHNVYIQLFCETGILGFTLFVSWFISSLVTAVKVCYRYYSDRIPARVKVQLMFALSYQIYFLMYCFSGNPLYDVYQYPVYFAACIIPMYYSLHLKKHSVYKGLYL